MCLFSCSLPDKHLDELRGGCVPRGRLTVCGEDIMMVMIVILETQREPEISLYLFHYCRIETHLLTFRLHQCFCLYLNFDSWIPT